MASKSQTKLKKTKSRELIDTNINSKANVNLAKNKASKSANDPNAINSVQNPNNNIKQKNDPNSNQQQNQNASINANVNVAANNANNANNGNNANVVDQKDLKHNLVTWVNTKNGSRVRKGELDILKDQWDNYKTRIDKVESKGIDIMKDDGYVPKFDGKTLINTAESEFHGFDVENIAETYKEFVKDKKYVFTSEPHNSKSAGFAVVMKMMDKLNDPGVLMLEAPAAFNQSDDIYKAITHWGTAQSFESKFGDLIKKAKDKKWKIVAVDATSPTSNASNELMTNAGLKSVISKREINGKLSGYGSKVRQAYIARNVYNTMKDNPNKGGILLIGNAHIKGGKVSELVPMVSNKKTSESNHASFDATDSGSTYHIAAVDPNDLNNAPKKKTKKSN